MLEIKNLSKTYKTAKGVYTKALDNISLNIGNKGMVFILGKSGSGKSTLLNVLGGLDSYDSGEIIINGKSSKNFKQSDFDSYRNTYIGFIFQDFNIIDNFTVGKNIALALQLQHKEASKEAIDEILKRVDLEGFGDRYPFELSGGQKQRVAIARALIKEPQMIMADEPTGALDSATSEQVLDTLKELSKEKLVLVVSHDRESAEKYADRIIEFKDGAIISDTNEEENLKTSNGTEELNLIKSRLPFADAFKLGITSLKNKKIRMVFSILLTVFALVLLGLSDGISSFDPVQAHIKAMLDNNDTVVGVSKYSSSLNENEVKEINKIAGNNSVKGYYLYNDGNIDVSDLGIMRNAQDLDSIYYSANYRPLEFLEISSFDRMGIKNHIGSLPSKDNEIVISNLLADYIIAGGIGDYKPSSYEQIIKDAKAFSLAGLKDVKIVGIVKYDLSEYDKLKSISEIDDKTNEDIIKLNSKFSSQSQEFLRVYVALGFVSKLKLPENTTLENDKAAIKIGKEETVIQNIGYYQSGTEYFNGTGMVKNDKINDNEIILSIGDIQELISDVNAEDFLNYINKNIIGKTLTLSNSVSNSYRIITTKLLSSADETKQLKVIGICLQSDMPSLMSKDVVSKHIIPSARVNSVYVSTSDKNVWKELFEKYPVVGNDTKEGDLYSNTKYSSSIVLYSSLSDLCKQKVGMFSVPVWISIVLMTFAVILTTNFIVTSVAFRKKEIGILRAIGARSMDVLKIFIWEGISLSTISFIVTMFPMFWIASKLNQGMAAVLSTLTGMDLNTNFALMSIRQPVLLILVLVVVTFISSLIPIIKVTRQKPVDTIKK